MKKKNGNNVLNIFIALVSAIAVLMVSFYAIVIIIGILQQYNERQVESDSGWLCVVDGRCCAEFATKSTDDMMDYLRSDLNNFSKRDVKRVKEKVIKLHHRIEEIENEYKDMKSEELKIIGISEKERDEMIKNNRECKSSQEKFLNILESM